jgi:hypothetical protein
MNNIIKYSVGFLDGVQSGKSIFLNHVGENTVFILKQYIDAEARSNPKALHHIYEWYKTGSPEARLYDFHYTVSNLGLSFKSNFKQSKTLSHDSSEPFYDKARVMEDGTPVTIRPQKSDALRFSINGEIVFTKKEVVVNNPGGDFTEGAFEKIADQFFNVYFRQSFLKSSGLYSYIKTPTLYKTNFYAGSKGGKNIGISTGFKWIANAKIGVE